MSDDESVCPTCGWDHDCCDCAEMGRLTEENGWHEIGAEWRGCAAGYSSEDSYFGGGFGYDEEPPDMGKPPKHCLAPSVMRRFAETLADLKAKGNLSSLGVHNLENFEKWLDEEAREPTEYVVKRRPKKAKKKSKFGRGYETDEDIDRNGNVSVWRMSRQQRRERGIKSVAGWDGEYHYVLEGVLKGGENLSMDIGPGEWVGYDGGLPAEHKYYGLRPETIKQWEEKIAKYTAERRALKRKQNAEAKREAKRLAKEAENAGDPKAAGSVVVDRGADLGKKRCSKPREDTRKKTVSKPDPVTKMQAVSISAAVTGVSCDEQRSAAGGAA